MRGCFILFLIVFLTACGQKGPLYLPEKPAEVKTTNPGEDIQDEEEDA
jgi:predicted small lipoprotein YifL|tara:strand:- start:88 stop:231 length:144 start_codon:yes stop_codon:yes gene_type:complete